MSGQLQQALSGKGLRSKRVKIEKEIKSELSRQNQNYIEYLAHHDLTKSESLDRG